MNMNLIDVESSNIAQTGYDPATSTLVITFKNGRSYEYYEVPQQEFDGFLAADSKGRYAQAHIYNSYPYRKL